MQIHLSPAVRRLYRICYGFDTYGEIFLLCIDRIVEKIRGKRSRFYEHSRAARLMKSDSEAYHIKDAKLPMLKGENFYSIIRYVLDDIFASYILFDDRYDEEIVDICDAALPEGLYGLVNDKVNVTVEACDIVIDAGSWIGDFAAYASVKGATTYAFEPSANIFSVLEKTAALNTNIIPVKKALGCDDSTNAKPKVFCASEDESFDIISLDDFVKDNNLPRVDFIKADIEGFERYMLAGAQETLARFAPKLALCTYHLHDDPQVMAELILKANPKYNIVQKSKKLYASVPE